MLEVGAGTDNATRLFAPRAAHLTALERDPQMAIIAAGSPHAPGNVTYRESDFEHAGLPSASFDHVISATAWHWVAPQLRNKLAADALAAGRVLAAFWNGPDRTGVTLQEQFEAVLCMARR